MKKLLFTATICLVTIVAQAQTHNESQGSGAGSSITTGDYNTFFGDSAGTNAITVSAVTAVGYSAGYGLNYYGPSSNLDYCTYFGAFSGYSNGFTSAVGGDQTFIGFGAGYNAYGTDLTFIGDGAGVNNTDGVDNVFIGSSAGYSNQTGDDNVFIGDLAGAGGITGVVSQWAGIFSYTQTTGKDCNDNTGVGSQAMYRITTGYRNAAFGNEALYDITTGHHNTAVGDSAGTDMDIAYYNTMIGAAAGAATEEGDYNTFIGAYAGFDNNRTNNTNDANRNTYMGYKAGYTNREGQDNVGIGYDADFNDPCTSCAGWNERNTFIGASSDVYKTNDAVVLGYNAKSYDNDFSLAIGSYSYNYGQKTVLMGGVTRADNTADYSVGIGHLDTIQGDYAVSIGYDSKVSADSSIAIGSGSESSGVNSVAIGFNSYVTADNQVIIGNSSQSTIGGIVNWTATSDGRFKSDVKENVGGLNFINLLRPVTYSLNTSKVDEFYGRTVLANNNKDVRFSGFIAQEVEVAAKNSDYNFSGVDAPEDASKEIYGLRYAEFVVPLVKAVQELSAKNKEQAEIIQLLQVQLKMNNLNYEQLKALVEELNIKVGSSASK